MNDSELQEAALYSLAFTDVSAGLLVIVKQLEKPRTMSDLVGMSADLKALAQRFESLTRGVLDLHMKVSV